MPLWFRRKARPGQEAPSEAAAREPLDDEDAREKEPEQAEAKPKPRRRTGARQATKGTKARAAQPAKAKQPAKARTPAKAPAKTPPKAEPAGERPRAARQRRRTPTPRLSALPKVEKEMLISFDVGEQRVAILEDGRPVEVYLERPGRRSIAGNVYKGIVDNVLPGMEASFVDIGLEKNGFLYVDEIVVPELEGRRHARRIQDLISRGEEVLVQAVKDPMGTKGARLTTEISLPGRFLVYTPFGDGIGVSRRLDDPERERLKGICKLLEVAEGGIIVRTAAEGASEEELVGDLAFLQKLWSTIQGRAARAKAPALVYREAELPLRVVRDLFRSDFERLAVDHERTYRRIAGYLKRTSPELARRVERYEGSEPLMERLGVDAAVRSTLDRRVDLPSGGYLIFDYAEAFTVIDVNTGRFVGARGKGASGRLEDTITKNNLEAVKEIVRQLRLRDIGGIIVIDFIDMANPRNREEVEEALKRELERDRTKTYVVEISPLGLVEMTRQNVTDGPREILTTRCPICSGDGIVVSDETYAVEAERALRRLGASREAEAFLIELPSHVAGILIGPAGSRLAEIEHETGKRFAFETRDDLPPDHVAVLAEGPAATIERQALPVARGEELDVRLEETHLRHPEDAIARVDGYVVSVARGAGRIGETVRVRVERATRTTAFASIVGAEDSRAVDEPVEAGTLVDEEADEQPPVKTTRRATRTGPGRKTAAASTAPAEEPAGEGTADAGAAAEEAAPKKRARRGTRGGRGRKKAEPVAAAEAEPEAAEPVEAGAIEEGEAQSPEAGQPKKPTRRGTRGGRGRKKAAPEAPLPEAAEQPEEPEVGVAETEEKPKKRARRGTRGGRGRKKAAASGVAEAAEEEAPATAPTETAPEAPEPSPESMVARKRTRRGTRGGRGRRKPGTTGASETGASPAVAASPDAG